MGLKPAQVLTGVESLGFTEGGLPVDGTDGAVALERAHRACVVERDSHLLTTHWSESTLKNLNTSDDGSNFRCPQSFKERVLY